ncbi:MULTISPECIES: TIGR03619 family F420-dependent LLM class oxidoreductase [unclassified Pseudofrankia]|uniref:TIGR03619 family F420-dependent LLM class oxidoreductase n=1 Tax=unclassified Pseudofrankia TaxID=2994372 RepID=UPI0008DB0EF1|nr:MULTISPECIES: TIGR03619 family F420-dependent LLM class oxidoreductase [unclassified Pseudofrankia]MDT3446546.1 TIGR03619 family F420-dependent LLM class oxidoreductase [Pseudofrankia sp. BMG5.37]OHV58708.1 LLM class F420-dependent oxidoreductase [Pseudofrankia sp. BMG5.36]
MSIGLTVYGLHPRDLLDLAVAADELGFDAIWLGEHIVLPWGYSSEHPTNDEAAPQHIAGPIIDPATELADPLPALAAAAAVTTSLKLATGIYLLPLRHPLVTARAVHTVHEISGGRLMLGVGSGWLREEFDALGVPFQGRGAAMEEALGVLRAAYAGGPFENPGPRFPFGQVQVSPGPVDVPLVLGGNSEKALRRAVRLGDAWFSSGTPSFEDAARLRDRIAQLCAEQGRDPLRCYFRAEKWDAETIGRYHAEGIDNLVIWADQVWPSGDLAEKRRTLAQAAEQLGLEPPTRTSN